MECDADGDGLRNDEESIKVNLAQPSTTHTDPTPLWMTDSTSVDHASYVSQYYGFDPYITEAADYDPLLSVPDVCSFPWKDLATSLRAMGVAGETKIWMFSFEENEGYDTDHDFKRDAIELSGLPTNGTLKVEIASNPQLFSDPDRRQALYLDGVNSAAASRDGQFRRAELAPCRAMRDDAPQGTRHRVGRCAGADVPEHAGAVFLQDAAVPFNVFHQVGAHHPALVGDAVVEGQQVQGRDGNGIAVGGRFQGCVGPVGVVGRRHDARCRQAVDIEIKLLREFVAVELVVEVRGVGVVMLPRQVGEDIVRGNLQAALDGNGLPVG